MWAKRGLAKNPNVEQIIECSQFRTRNSGQRMFANNQERKMKHPFFRWPHLLFAQWNARQYQFRVRMPFFIALWWYHIFSVPSWLNRSTSARRRLMPSSSNAKRLLAQYNFRCESGMIQTRAMAAAAVSFCSNDSIPSAHSLKRRWNVRKKMKKLFVNM